MTENKTECSPKTETDDEIQFDKMKRARSFVDTVDGYGIGET